MMDNRRIRVADGTHFFTINLPERHSNRLVRNIEALREEIPRYKVGVGR